MKFHENPSSGSRIVPCGQTDRHDEDNSRVSQVYERSKYNTSGITHLKILVYVITWPCNERIPSPWSLRTGSRDSLLEN